jgi:hypothetical protein
MPRRKRQFGQPGTVEEQFRLRVIGVDDRRRVMFERADNGEFPIARHEHVKPIGQLFEGPRRPSRGAPRLFLLGRGVNQRHVRTAENQLRVRPGGTQDLLNSPDGHQLGRRRRQTENLHRRRGGVTSDRLFVVRDTGQVDHFDGDARLLEHGRDFENAQRHEDPLVEQKDRRRNDQTDPEHRHLEIPRKIESAISRWSTAFEPRPAT